MGKVFDAPPKSRVTTLTLPALSCCIARVTDSFLVCGQRNLLLLRYSGLSFCQFSSLRCGLRFFERLALCDFRLPCLICRLFGP